MRNFWRCLAACLVISFAQACSSTSVHSKIDHAGDQYELRLQRESETSSDGSSGSSSSKFSLIERVIDVQSDGLILEFDLPLDSSAEDRAREWQFPARVFRALDGSHRLTNAAELKSRNQAWLELGDIDPAYCGRWIFTWTAVKIECDPQSVLKSLEPFDLRIDNLKAGEMYSDPGALAPKPLSLMQKNGSNGSSFFVKMDVDPDTIRRERAEADTTVAEMLGGQPLSLEEALQSRSSDQVYGTIAVTIDTDDLGRVTRRVRVVEIETKKESGSIEKETTTETVQRELTNPR